MKIGDLVKKKSDWVRHNPWMSGTELDDSPDTLGIIVKVEVPACSITSGWYIIEWLNGGRNHTKGDRLEAVWK